MARMSVKDGRLVLPDGMSYHVLVLPESLTMTPALLRKVRKLFKAGATVIGSPPLKSPSLSGYPKCDAEVHKLAAEIWGDGVMASQSDRTQAGSSAPRLQRSETALSRGRVIRARAVQPAGAEASPSLIEQAKWIWHKEGNPAISAPVGPRYFRRSFTVVDRSSVESAGVVMTADNSFELWINGRRAGKGDNFHVAGEFDVKGMLRSGVNVLAVAAENGGADPNPAGLAGILVVEFRDRTILAVPTDSSWQTAQVVGGKWTADSTPEGEWAEAMELGPIGMAPWGAVQKPALEPEQYCDFGVVSKVLGELGLMPDFESDGPLRYAHRRTSEEEIYFVANREDRSVEANCTFRVSGKAPELWDPLTGQTRSLPEFTTRGRRTTVPMRFEPAQSFFVVFRKPAARAAGRNFPVATRLAKLPGPWKVSFDPRWGGPELVVFETLQDWSKRSEEGIRYYSGRAVYRTTFDAPEVAPGRRLYLDLGRVKNLAQVRLNGRDLGIVWCAPWRVDITEALNGADNQLEIAVANLWPNRLIGDQSLPAEQRLTSTTWNPFRKDSTLLASGLLGPVTIVAERADSRTERSAVRRPLK